MCTSLCGYCLFGEWKWIWYEQQKKKSFVFSLIKDILPASVTYSHYNIFIEGDYVVYFIIIIIYEWLWWIRRRRRRSPQRV